MAAINIGKAQGSRAKNKDWMLSLCVLWSLTDVGRLYFFN